MHLIADAIAGVKGIFTKAEKIWVKAIDYTASALTSCGVAFFDVLQDRVLYSRLHTVCDN